MRTLSFHSSYCLEESEKKIEKKGRKQKPSSSLPSQSSSKSRSSSSLDNNSAKAHRQRGHQHLINAHMQRRSGPLLQEVQGRRNKHHLFSFNVNFGNMNKVLDFIQQFDAAFGDENFLDHPNSSMLPCIFKNQPDNGGQAYAPKTWKTCKVAIMKQFLLHGAFDQVLMAWRSLKLEDEKNMQSQESKEKETVDIIGHMELLKKIQREKNMEEQKRQEQEEDEENLEKIQLDPTPPSPNLNLQSLSSKVPSSLASPPPPKSFVPLSPPKQAQSTKEGSTQAPSQTQSTEDLQDQGAKSEDKKAKVAPLASPPPPKSSAPSSPPKQTQSTKEGSIEDPSQTQSTEDLQDQGAKSEDKKVKVAALEQQEQANREILEPHPPGPPQEAVQIHLPKGETLEPRRQSPSSRWAVQVPNLIIQTNSSQEDAWEVVKKFDYYQVLNDSI
ncbi:hypothetical protein L7F22_032704 [Adiantum nelumboides]|nr:hypothetical protein [Adiantum nelumboides]